jgi:hypothetical protein
MTQRVCNDICISRVIVDFQLIVLDQLEPSLLPHVQIRLGKDVLQAFVVHIDSVTTSVTPSLLLLTQDHG